MTTAAQKRQAVLDKYDIIIGRNYYSQPKRNYCYRRYSDGRYYSDCSSSISYAYKEAGYGFGILNTVGMYTNKNFETVPVHIVRGQIQNVEVLRPGDMLLFAGSSTSRAYAGYVGHVEMVYSIVGHNVTICGHGSGRPSFKNMKSYCDYRYKSKSNTKLGHRGLIKVVRSIPNDESTPDVPDRPIIPDGDSVIVTGYSVHVRTSPSKLSKSKEISHRGDTFELANIKEWQCVTYKNQTCWISRKYFTEDGVCTGGHVRVRIGSGTEFESIGTINKGDRLPIVKYDGWNPIVVGDRVCWISAKYSKIK